MDKVPVTKAMMKRLPVYLSYLKEIPDGEFIYISATAIAGALELGEVQVRKDLALVSNGGKPKVGYLREALINDLEHFLGYDYTDNAILVGAGKLGQALLDYSGFSAFGMNVLAGFDVMPDRAQTDSGKPIYPMEKLQSFIKSSRVRIAILTVPVEQAQAVCDQLLACGILAILNFAPTRLEVPDNILVQNENLATSLAVISRHVQAAMREKK